VAVKLLKPGGELIVITPRSFSSGNYFRAFREVFFNEVRLSDIHLFGSRTETFSRESVLQETVIVKAVRVQHPEREYDIRLTHSRGLQDLGQSMETTYRAAELVDFDSKEKILHLPLNADEDKVIKLFRTWTGNLAKYDLQISTGPVVSFRAVQYLHERPNGQGLALVPLFQLQNTEQMAFSWPVFKKQKPQYIELGDQTRSMLVPNKDYIFLRRFSAKDDKHRLIAAPYFSDSHESDLVGIENHLNYIYRPNGRLDRNEVLGLCALLNSVLFDTYFRTFNGNINVSATELREMPLPPLEVIREIGNEIILAGNPLPHNIEEIVGEIISARFTHPPSTHVHA